MPKDDAILQMLGTMQNDIITIRDNHLAHIQADISEIKVKQATHGEEIAVLKKGQGVIERVLLKIVTVGVVFLTGVQVM